MKILDHLAQAAAVILLVELLVVLLIFLAISGGLAFGLRWVRGKSDWAFEKANSYLPQVTGYVHTGTDYAAKPVIMVSGFAETVKGTAEALRERVRAVRAARMAPAPAESQVHAPLVTILSPADETTEVTEVVAARPVQPVADGVTE